MVEKERCLDETKELTARRRNSIWLTCGAVAGFFFSVAFFLWLMSLIWPEINSKYGLFDSANVYPNIFGVGLGIATIIVLVLWFKCAWNNCCKRNYLLAHVVVPKKKRQFKKRYSDFERKTIIDNFREPCEDVYASIFATAILTPQSLFRYIDDRVEPYTRSLKVTSSMEILLPYSLRNSPVVLPIIMYQRGDVPNTINIKNASGALVSSLNYQESVEYTLDVIKCYCPEIQTIACLELKIFDYLSCLKPIDSIEDIEHRIDEANEIITCLENQVRIGCKARGRDEEKKSLQSLEVVKQILIKLARSYPICVRCKPSENPDNGQMQNDRPLSYASQKSRSFSLMVSHRLTLVKVSCFSETDKRRFLDKIIRRPMTIYYDLENADRTQSYHLQMKGHDHGYYSYGRFQSIANRGKSALADVFGLQRCVGQRHARLAAQNGFGFNNLSFMFCYEQRSLTFHHIALIVMLTELVALVMMFSIGSDYRPLSASIEKNNSNDISSVTITLIVALAGIVSAWITDKANAEREAQIVPKFGSVFAIFVALVVGLCFFSEGETREYAMRFLFFSVALLAAGSLWIFMVLFYKNRVYSYFKQEKKLINVAEESNSEVIEARPEAPRTQWSPGWRAKSNFFYPLTNEELDNDEMIFKMLHGNPNYVRDALVGLAD